MVAHTFYCIPASVCQVKGQRGYFQFSHNTLCVLGQRSEGEVSVSTHQAMFFFSGHPHHISSPTHAPHPPTSPHTHKHTHTFTRTCMHAHPHAHPRTHTHTHTHRHCTYHQHSDLLQEVLLAVGYFSVLHPDNQVR